MNKNAHVICHDGQHKPPYMLECLRCGTTYAPAIPVEIMMFVAMAKQFEKSHTECEPRKKR